jgi:hypothetical protein
MPMKPRGPAARAAQPWSWERVAPLDTALACAVVLACLALCIQSVPPLLGKLKLIETVFNLPAQNWPQAEALALTGRLDTLDPTEPQLLAGWRYGRQDGQAVATGSLRDGEAELSLGMRLAVAEQGLGWHSLPLCGLRPAPAGWRAHAQPLAQGIPDQQLPYVCSNR